VRLGFWGQCTAHSAESPTLSPSSVGTSPNLGGQCGFADSRPALLGPMGGTGASGSTAAVTVDESPAEGAAVKIEVKSHGDTP
jgi:hypothetical protein